MCISCHRGKIPFYTVWITYAYLNMCFLIELCAGINRPTFCKYPTNRVETILFLSFIIIVNLLYHCTIKVSEQYILRLL